MTATVRAATVTLGWQPRLDLPAATAFLVEAGSTAGGTDVGVFDVGLATSVAGTLAPGTYFARVRGVGTSGPGAASSEVVVTVPPTSATPNAPGAYFVRVRAANASGPSTPSNEVVVVVP